MYGSSSINWASKTVFSKRQKVLLICVLFYIQYLPICKNFLHRVTAKHETEKFGLMVSSNCEIPQSVKYIYNIATSLRSSFSISTRKS